MIDETEKSYLAQLGKKISERRKAKKLSQQKLAELCQMEKANLSRIESGKTNSTVLTLKKIAFQVCDSFPELFME